MKNKIFKIGYYILFSLLIIILIYSFTLIYKWVKEKDETQKIMEKVKIITTTNSNTFSDIVHNNNIEDIIKQNNDTVAYMKVNLTDIEYPIVQTTDNEFYLKHSFNKNVNQAGWIYMDYQNSKEFNDENTIIYAHNRKDGTMFGTLDNLLHIDLTKNYPLIYIQTVNKLMVYQIFSVYIIETEDYYLQKKFSVEEKQAWLKNIQIRNQAVLNNEVKTEDKILTLSTCYDNDDKRLVVHAKKIMN